MPSRADDLIVEENEDVLKALKRLPPQEAYDRVYRLRRAMQCSSTAKILPKSEWTKPEEVRTAAPTTRHCRAPPTTTPKSPEGKGLAAAKATDLPSPWGSLSVRRVLTFPDSPAGRAVPAASRRADQG